MHDTYLRFHNIKLSCQTLEVGVEVDIAHDLHQLLSIRELFLIQLQKQLLEKEVSTVGNQ